jgi:hypothetical protein
MDYNEVDRQRSQDDMEEYLKMENSKLLTKEEFEKLSEELNNHEEKPN